MFCKFKYENQHKVTRKHLSCFTLELYSQRGGKFPFALGPKNSLGGPADHQMLIMKA
jgi:hypothetical protein